MKALKLLITSGLILVLELVLIRYLSTEIPAVGFFKNLILISAFLGLGVGLNLKIRLRTALILSGVSGALPLVLVRIGAIFDLIHPFPGFADEAVLWGPPSWELLALGVLLLCFSFLSAMTPFIFLGRLLGVYFDEYREALRAYGWNILGSLVGTVLFALLCFFAVPPSTWFLICAVLWAALFLLEFGELGSRITAQLMFVVFLQIILAATWGERATWTPYYKITFFDMSYRDGQATGHGLRVNNTWFQASFDMNFLGRTEELEEHASSARNLRFVAPFDFVKPRSVLVLGSGLGNDTASALTHGVEHIDAVDIDPGIIALSEHHHPNQPYKDSRVHTIIDDARHFLETTGTKYDLILFGVLEARTLFSHFANLRLDNYVYTREGLEATKIHLTNNGVVWLNIWIPKAWVLEKFVLLMEEVFGDEFLVLHGVGSKHYSFVAWQDPEQRPHIPDQLLPGVEFAQLPKGVEPPTVPTDDWPYVFFKRRSLPATYILLLGVLILVSLAPLRIAYKDLFHVEWGFFCLGGAFLLLEASAVTRMALLAGTTWVVNTSVFTGVLVFIFIANLAMTRWRLKNTVPLFVCLILSLLLAYGFPFSKLLTLPNHLAISIAAGLLTLPILFAGCIFSTYLRSAVIPSRALGSNIFGAVMGGFAEYVSMLSGNRAMVLLALVAYLGAWIAFSRDQRRRNTATTADPLAGRDIDDDTGQNDSEKVKPNIATGSPRI